jgi:hypothetical protein
MDTQKIETLKKTLGAVKESLDVLKIKATAICSTIDAQELVPDDISKELSRALEKYDEQETQLGNLCSDLSIKLGTKLSDISAAVLAYEELCSTEKLREIVLDYFMLNSEAADIKNVLESSKLALIKKCTGSVESAAESIPPYGLVVSTVKESAYPLQKEKFERILKGINFDIAYATDRGQLFFDKTIDLTKFANGSSPLLTITEIESPHPVADASTSAPGEGTVAIKKEKEIEQVKQSRWDKFGGYVSDLATISISDNKERPTLSAIRELTAQDSNCLPVLWNLGNEKLIPKQAASSGSSRIESPKAIELLHNCGFLAELIVSENGKRGEYLTLSSKAWNCFSEPDIREYFSKQNPPLLLPNNLIFSCNLWSPVAAVRASMINEYFRIKCQNYVMWATESGMLFARPTAQTQITIAPGLFSEGVETTTLKEISMAINALQKSEHALILVRKVEDIAVLAHEFEPSERKEILFAVAASDYSVFDADAVACEIPTAVSAQTDIENIIPENKLPDPVLATLTAMNSPKANNASASKFKKEIISFSKQFNDVLTILPLFTNLGLLKRKQIFEFGIRLGFYNDEEPKSNQVNAAIDYLCSKGMLAQYQYEGNEIFGLSSYCHDSMRKKEIDSMHLWPLSSGDRTISCGKEIKQSVVERAINANTALLQYLTITSSQMEETEYTAVKRSIKWIGECYAVDYFFAGEQIPCLLNFIPSDRFDLPNNSLILSADHADEASIYSMHSNKIFIISDSAISLWSSDSHDENTIKSAKSEAAPNVTPTVSGAVASACEAVDEIQSQNIEQSKKVVDLCRPVAEENETEAAVEHTGETQSSGLTQSEDIPSDETFRAKAVLIINTKAETDQVLFANITNALLLSRTAGFINGYTTSRKFGRRLQLATNILFNECSYSSNDLTTAFDDEDLNNQAITLAAYCFAMLMPAEAHDYALLSQCKDYFERFETVFSSFVEYKNLFSKLMSVTDVLTTGFTPAVVASLGDDTDNRAFINSLKSQAKNFLTYLSPNVRGLPQLNIMYSSCFGKNSDLYECMAIISENRTDDAEFVKTVLSEYCKENGGIFALEATKLEQKLDAFWTAANSKKDFILKYSARDRAAKQFKLRIDLMQTWLEHLSKQANVDENLSRAKTLRADLLDTIKAVDADDNWKSKQCSSVLQFMLRRMDALLSGHADQKELFADLLLTGIISVGSDGMPVLDESHTEVRFNEPWRNVIRHLEAKKKSIPAIRDEILGSTGDDSGLLDNLNQLKLLGAWQNSTDDDYKVGTQQFKDAIDAAELRTRKFYDDLELAYTYNQINETEKETLAGIVKHNEPTFFEIGDFACWRKFLNGLKMQVEECASIRQASLRGRLQENIKKAPDSALLAAASDLLERPRNLAVAEEYMNRFESGECEPPEELEVIINDEPYFEQFLSPNVFNPLFDACSKRRARGESEALKYYGWSYLDKKLPAEWTARQRKDSEELVSSWPVGKGRTTPISIQTLFSCLGLKIRNVNKASGYKEEIFKLSVAPTPRSKADYLHPIAAFGTQMKSPLNVIVLYGNYTEKQLVDTISSLDLGGISIVLIDRPLEIASRRQIGEIFHTQTSGQNPFLLIDQVLLLFLASHQITERLPALLQCTLPYSSYQPFVQDSGPTADEMFCGRTLELGRIIDPNGACVVYGGRQLGKTALLQRAENRCMNPESKSYAVYVSIANQNTEAKVVETISSAIDNKTNGAISISPCTTLKAFCNQLSHYFRNGTIARMHLLIDEVDTFLEAIAPDRYIQIQPLVDLKRETTNNFKFVIAGLHNVCRAKNATAENGIFGQLGTPLCIKPLSPTDALQLLSRPLRYLGFQIDRYPHLETILTVTNYYPGIIQFFGYMLVETLSSQYSKYYRAANGNPPFTLRDDQLSAVINSADLNRSIKDKFRWSLELDTRYFMIARCITMLYHYYADDRNHGSWLGFSVEQIMEMAESYHIHCLEKESYNNYVVLLDEMKDMGILSKPDAEKPRYRLRRNSFVDIIGDNFEILDAEIISNNKER